MGAPGGGLSITPLPTETAARQEAAGGSAIEMNRLGIILKTSGKLDEAGEWFVKAAELGSQDAMANMAMLCLQKGRKQEAAQWFRRAGGPLGEAMAEQLLAESGDGGEGADGSGA